MEREQIEAFLSIVNNGTISAAANSLYTTQSSISKKISLLEEEAGVPLFSRGRGYRKVELTSYGESFLSIARKWEALNKEFDSIKYSSEIHEVSIGATDLVNRITLKELYTDILTNHTNYRLDIHNHHSAQIYKMMESRNLDLGYVNLLLPVSNITVKKLFDERFVVLMHTKDKLPPAISYKDLDPAREIYSRWNDEFEIWHDQYWPHRMYRIRVGTGSMISDYLDQEGRWTIAPVSCIQGLMNLAEFQYAELDIETPKRAMYLLEQKNINQSRLESIIWIKTKIQDHLNDSLTSVFPAD